MKKKPNTPQYSNDGNNSKHWLYSSGTVIPVWGKGGLPAFVAGQHTVRMQGHLFDDLIWIGG